MKLKGRIAFLLAFLSREEINLSKSLPLIMLEPQKLMATKCQGYQNYTFHS